MESANKMGFHLQFANSVYRCGFYNNPFILYTTHLFYTRGFHKFYGISQILLRIQQFRLFLDQFWAVQF